MRMALMMAMQTAQVAGPPLPAELRPVKPLPVETPCDQPDADGTIVVCARRSDADRLAAVDPDRYAQKPIRAATRIGNVRLSGEAEQGVLPNGMSSPRAMIRLKMPF